ncbi:MAG: hypothetical protein QG551_114 [Patescibacteria group bacterium]|jgi:hypothetical protein|nr:hypothetical protein [Patescibacteria group bacterium]
MNDIVTPSCRLHFYFTPLPVNSSSKDLVGIHHLEKYPEPSLPRITPNEFQIKAPVQVGRLHLPEGTKEIRGVISEVWFFRTVTQLTKTGLRVHCVELKVAVELPTVDQDLFNKQVERFFTLFEYCSISY